MPRYALVRNEDGVTSEVAENAVTEGMTVDGWIERAAAPIDVLYVEDRPAKQDADGRWTA